MKGLYTFLLFLFSTCVTAQQYYPVLGNSNEWSILQSFEGSWLEYYSIKGDSVINNKTYKILDSDSRYGISAFLREDTLDMKIYAIIPTLEDSGEIVYLDFSLLEGDSIYLTSITNWDSRHWCWVDSIRTINTLSGPRKAYYLKRDKTELDGYEYPIWVQGIGHLGHPEYRMHSVDEWNTGELACSFKDGIKTFSTDNIRITDNCEINTVGIDSQKTSLFKVFPNPANSFILIEPTDSNAYLVTIYDISGKQLISEWNSREVNLNNIQSGMYIVSIETKSKLYKQRLIINK